MAASEYSKIAKRGLITNNMHAMLEEEDVRALANANSETSIGYRSCFCGIAFSQETNVVPGDPKTLCYGFAQALQTSSRDGGGCARECTSHLDEFALKFLNNLVQIMVTTTKAIQELRQPPREGWGIYLRKINSISMTMPLTNGFQEINAILQWDRTMSFPVELKVELSSRHPSHPEQVSKADITGKTWSDNYNFSIVHFRYNNFDSAAKGPYDGKMKPAKKALTEFGENLFKFLKQFRTSDRQANLFYGDYIDFDAITVVVRRLNTHGTEQEVPSKSAFIPKPVLSTTYFTITHTFESACEQVLKISNVKAKLVFVPFNLKALEEEKAADARAVEQEKQLRAEWLQKAQKAHEKWVEQSRQEHENLLGRRETAEERQKYDKAAPISYGKAQSQPHKSRSQPYHFE